jgi:hypothetical protein
MVALSFPLPVIRRSLIAVLFFLLVAICSSAAEPEGKAPPRKDAEGKPADSKANDKAKEITGKSEFLRSVPKHFAILK